MNKRTQQTDQERHDALLREAANLDLRAMRDYMKDGQWIIWAPTLKGQCELTTATNCTCRRFRAWHRCPCTAMVQDLESMVGAEAA